MIAAAIDKILSLGQPLTVKVNNEDYSTLPLKRVNKELRAEELEVATLSSLVDYIHCFNQDMKDTKYIVHIVTPTRVELISSLDSDRERETLMVVNAEVPKIPFGMYIDNEKMIITVQSMFLNDPKTDRDAILKFAGTVTCGSIKEYGDDGVTQKAIIKQGVASKAEAIVPSPCVLRPFRTFREVEQPASTFIFRMRDGAREIVEFAIFEADGGEWRNEARENIRVYLEERLAGTGVTVIA